MPLNLSSLKNLLPGLTLPTQSEIPSAPESPQAGSVSPSTADVVKLQVSLKQKQMRRGTTRTEVERAKVKFEAARVALAQSERVDADEDSTAVMQRMTRAEEEVRDKEKELTIAIRKDEAALAALTNAERQAVITADNVALTAFKDSVLELEAELRGALKPAVDKVAAARLAVKDRSEGDSVVGSALVDFDAWFKVYLHRDCSALVPGGRTYSKTLDEEQKPLSAWVDSVTHAMTYRRKGL